MTTKNTIKEMMNNTNQELLYEDNNTLEYENPCYGESICFSFNDDGFLIKVYS